MRKWIRKSFKRRQLLGFLLVALMPMLISSLSMTRLVQVKVESDYEKRVEQQTEEVDVALNQLFSLLEDTVKNIEENKKIITTIEEMTDNIRQDKTSFIEIPIHDKLRKDRFFIILIISVNVL